MFQVDVCLRFLSSSSKDLSEEVCQTRAFQNYWSIGKKSFKPKAGGIRDRKALHLCRSEAGSLSSRIILQLGVFIFWGIFHHSELTSETDSYAEQRLQIVPCVSRVFQPATVTNIYQNLEFESSYNRHERKCKQQTQAHRYSLSANRLL